MLRRVKQDVLNQLPPKSIAVERVQLEPAQRLLYNSLLRDAATSKASFKPDSDRPQDEGTLDQHLSTNSELKHLFTALRKAANHPLLLRTRYADAVLPKLTEVALAHEHFGPNCEYHKVFMELKQMSDLDLHQFCCTYPSYLKDLELDSQALYDSPKLQRLKILLPTLLVSGLFVFCILCHGWIL